MQELAKKRASEVLKTTLEELREYKKQLCAMSVDLVSSDLVIGTDALTGERAVVFRGESLEKLETLCKYVEVLGAINRAELSVTEITKELGNEES